MLYTIYYILFNRMEIMRVCGDLKTLREYVDHIILEDGIIQCIKDQNGEIVII